jgi:hypothetical protein
MFQHFISEIKKGAFVGLKNLSVIKMHGATIKLS